MQHMAESAEKIKERVGSTYEGEMILVEVIKTLTEDLKETERSQEYLENNSQRNNIRIYPT